jgi:uncharacterized protein with HEPN domain
MKDNKLYLLHILECIDKINSYTSSGENEFSKSTLLQDAVMRNLEIIGEATKNISLDLRQKHPQIPWRKMAGLRDILIHNYMGVNIRTVWNIVKNELPAVKKDVQNLLQDMS